jgi:cytidylate kinase
MRRVVTIDGPAGAGKSTVARMLAERLRWRLLDTGAMYRAVTLAALRAGVDLESDLALGNLASHVMVRLPPGRVMLDGEDISALIRSVEVTRASRYLADSPSVRRQLVVWQRNFATEYDVIAEGRDQGTVVFPDAFRKFFLTATLDERARRRHAEFAARGEPITRESVRKDLEERDARDAARAIAPMKPAADATVIDTTGLALDVVVSCIEQDIRADSHDSAGPDAGSDLPPTDGCELTEGRTGA